MTYFGTGSWKCKCGAALIVGAVCTCAVKVERVQICAPKIECLPAQEWWAGGDEPPHPRPGRPLNTLKIGTVTSTNTISPGVSIAAPWKGGS